MRRKILTKMEDVAEIAEEISRIKNVKAVYLFGSQATGRAHKLSDIDLCVIGDLSEKERHKAMEALSDNLDISMFDDLPIWIKFRIFREGKLLIIKDKEFLNKIKIRTLKEYLDFKPIINRYCLEVLGCTI